jgi:hypothetical protein
MPTWFSLPCFASVSRLGDTLRYLEDAIYRNFCECRVMPGDGMASRKKTGVGR